MDTLIIKLMSLAVHAEELIESWQSGRSGEIEWDVRTIQSLLIDPEIADKRAELDALALLPVKRSR